MKKDIQDVQNNTPLFDRGVSFLINGVKYYINMASIKEFYKVNNSKFIKKTEEIAKRYKHNTVYVLPPCHYLYRSMMPDKKILFREIYKLKEKYNVKVIDMYEADIGSKSSYGDSDHLSRLGGGIFMSKFVLELKPLLR